MFSSTESVLLGLLAAMWQMFLVLFVLPVRLLIRFFKQEVQLPESKANMEKHKQIQNENERQKGCRDVVVGYANHLGYIARECMSREEIEQKIDSGISPQALANEIQNRIDAVPGIILGQQMNVNHPIKLPYSLRDRHVYVIGKSGSGKTNSLRQWIMQDLANDCGVGVLAPEAEFITEEILPYIPEERINDVVYFNPSDTQRPIPFNPLHLDVGEDIDRRVDDNVTIFQQVAGETGARMEEILRQTFYALLERPGSTLLDIERLLTRTDDSFRREIIATTNDEQTAYFFANTYPSYAKDAHTPITTRIGRLIRNRLIRTMLCQPGKSFNFREAMDDGKILLFNLSDGLFGQQTSQILGQLIVSKIQTAVFSRADTAKTARRPFYLYLDEFQTYVGVNENSYSRLLSRSRKYAFGLVLAHQQTGQLTDELLKEILGNVSTIISFMVSNTDAGKLSNELIFDTGAEVTPIDKEDLLRLKVGEAWAKIGKTTLPLKTRLADQQPDMLRAKEVIERSRINYGQPVIEPPNKRKPRFPKPPQNNIPKQAPSDEPDETDEPPETEDFPKKVF